MLKGVLRFAGEGGGRPSADEIAVLEQRPVRLATAEQVVDRRRPERMANHRCQLQNFLLGWLEKIDACGQDRLNGIGNGDPRRHLAQAPAVAVCLQRSLVYQRAEELFDEEWVPFGPSDQIAELIGEWCVEEGIGHSRCVVRRERLEPDQRRLFSAGAPPASDIEELRPRRSDQQEWATYVAHQQLEQAE